MTSSHPWKQSLESQAKTLQELMKLHRLSDATLVKLEETIVLGCYTIRRLTPSNERSYLWLEYSNQTCFSNSSMDGSPFYYVRGVFP